MSYGVSFEDILQGKKKHREKGKNVVRQKAASLEIKIPLGTRVKYSSPLLRVRRDRGRREWISQPWSKGGEGVVVGLRLLQNGEYISHYEEWPYLAVEDYQWAYMIAFDLRRNPVFVRPEDLEVLDDAR